MSEGRRKSFWLRGGSSEEGIRKESSKKKEKRGHFAYSSFCLKMVLSFYFLFFCSKCTVFTAFTLSKRSCWLYGKGQKRQCGKQDGIFEKVSDFGVWETQLQILALTCVSYIVLAITSLTYKTEIVCFS